MRRSTLGVLIGLFLLLAPKTGSTQSGNLFVTNFFTELQQFDTRFYSIYQDEEGTLLFANRRGIIAFDGSDWNYIETPGMPFVMKSPENSSRIYVGCKDDFGYLEKDSTNTYKYNSANSYRSNIGNVSRIGFFGDNVLFYSPTNVIIAKEDYPEGAEIWQPGSRYKYQGLIQHEDQVIVNVTGIGWKSFGSDLPSDTTGSYFTDKNIVCSVPFYNNHTLISTNNSELFLYNGKTVVPYACQAADYLTSNVVTGGISLNEQEFALTTLTGGCVIIDKSSGTTSQIVNYQNGLPDDELFAILQDNNKGIWVSHEFGLSRIDYRLPVRSFDSYPGIEGNILSIVRADTNLYVGTSEGVFKLSSVKSYEEIRILIEEENPEKETGGSDTYIVRTPAKDEIIDPLLTEAPPVDTLSMSKKELRQWRREQNRIEKEREKAVTDGPKRNWLGIKIKDRDKEKEAVVDTISDVALRTSEEPRHKRRRRKTYSEKVIYALQSVTHIYKKINGTKNKCKHFLETDHGLLVGSNNGLYWIQDTSATLVIPNNYVNAMMVQDRNHVVIGTSTGISILEWKDGAWVGREGFKSINTPIYSVTSGIVRELWLGSDNVVYRVTVDANLEMKSKHRYEIRTKFAEKVLVRKVAKMTFFFLPSGIYSYDRTNDSIAPGRTVDAGWQGSSQFIARQDDLTWIYDGSEWANLKNEIHLEQSALEFLKPFKNINDIFIDDDKNIWLVDNHSHIYKIIYDKTSGYRPSFEIFMKDAWSKSFSINNLQDPLLNYENNSVSFTVAAPFFLMNQETRYQYMVEDLVPEWTPWSNNRKINLPYLPEGTYKIKIRAKNVFGNESNVLEYEFVILPPFYRRWWFYLICLAGGIGLVMFAVRLRAKQLLKKNADLESKIRQRTAQLEEEKMKSEVLLLNILPAETAEELKQTGRATPHQYDDVSVIFTDFSGFTEIAAKMSPKALVEELDRCFEEFDAIAWKYGIEKIKTIGDSYMATTGLPVENEQHAIISVLACMEIVDFMTAHNKRRESKGELFWEVRVGIHSGPVVSGVVGKRKFAYDIWGDTVNTAARLESSGEVGAINISQSTFDKVKQYVDCQERGKIKAKGKGEISMYFVSRIKPEYSEDDKGRKPNKTLKKKLFLSGTYEI